MELELELERHEVTTQKAKVEVVMETLLLHENVFHSCESQ